MLLTYIYNISTVVENSISAIMLVPGKTTIIQNAVQVQALKRNGLADGVTVFILPVAGSFD